VQKRCVFQLDPMWNDIKEDLLKHIDHWRISIRKQYIKKIANTVDILILY